MEPLSTPPPAIDADALNDYTMGLHDLQESLLRGFCNELEPRIAILRAAIAQGDATAMWHGAHYLKGAALQLGCKPIAAAALQLETAGRSGHMEDAPQLLEALEREAARFPEALAAFLRR
jgi:HPt (histidine-containing phosphotransfer) domain-containing protein